MPIEHIRLSQHAKDRLIKLKRDSGIMQWNVLCRWAFCISLAESSVPPDAEIPADSNVEMDWKTFGGEYGDIYWALLTCRCKKDGMCIGHETLCRLFRLHLHRGIAYLTAPGYIGTIGDLANRASPQRIP